MAFCPCRRRRSCYGVLSVQTSEEVKLDAGDENCIPSRAASSLAGLSKAWIDVEWWNPKWGMPIWGIRGWPRSQTRYTDIR
ncbi:unnamed protein product, partial [Protopolystoma xenopodis]